MFDGICNLCDSSVQYVIKHDKKDVFRFVALQSELGQKILKHIQLPKVLRDDKAFRDECAHLAGISDIIIVANQYATFPSLDLKNHILIARQDIRINKRM